MKNSKGVEREEAEVNLGQCNQCNPIEPITLDGPPHNTTSAELQRTSANTILAHFNCSWKGLLLWFVCLSIHNKGLSVVASLLPRQCNSQDRDSDCITDPEAKNTNVSTDTVGSEALHCPAEYLLRSNVLRLSNNSDQVQGQNVFCHRRTHED